MTRLIHFQCLNITAPFPSKAYISLKHESDKVIVFERGNLLWIFNFHPTNSFPDYKVGTEWAGEYRVVLNTDNKRFNGFGRIDESVTYFTSPEPWNNRKNSLMVRKNN